jgi:hypothetical protein
MPHHKAAALSLFVSLFLMLTPASAAEVNRSFPPDPAGYAVIDRAVAIIYGDSSHALYAVMYNTQKSTIVDIYRSSSLKEKLTWKKAYGWKPEMEGETHPLPSPSVLMVRQDDDTVTFSIIYIVKRYEGMVTFYLSYDIKSGRFEKGWSD